MKLPSFQFYPGDWLKDPNLSRASLQAKGALIEILCIAFECEKRGVLKTGSHPWSIDEIARAMRGETIENIKAVGELLELKVLKKDRKNAIFSSRMCKDENLRKIRREAGLKGGNPNLVKQTANQKLTPSSSSSSSSSDNIERAAAANAPPKLKTFKQWDEKEFYDQIAIYKQNYSKEMLRLFYNHWSEKSTSGKMKFQLERTWEMKKRLEKWQANESIFNKNGNGVNGSHVYAPTGPVLPRI